MRRTSLGQPPGFSDEVWKKWVENSLRSLERATYVNTAEQVSFNPTTTIAAENVQDALAELEGDVIALASTVANLSTRASVLEANDTRLIAGGMSFVTIDSLGAGYLVNITSTSGAKCRLADGGGSVPANGFVVTSYSSGSTATVYFMGLNTFVKSSSGSTFDAGDNLYLSTDGGKVTNVLPATGNFNQFVGFCLSSLNMFFFPGGARDPDPVSS